MNIEARKYRLIEKVMAFDEKQIAQIELFIKQEADLAASLEKAIDQVNEGKTIPHEQVR